MASGRQGTAPASMSGSRTRRPYSLGVDTPLTNRVIATSPIGQAAQAVVYVPNAVPGAVGTSGLQPLGKAGEAAHVTLGEIASGETRDAAKKAPTSVALFDQGLVQILQASVTGLEPKKPYVLALSTEPQGKGMIEALSAFMTNPAGSAIVNATGPIRQILQSEAADERRYLTIVSGTPDALGAPVQGEIP